jgi:aminomethyltransferase
VKLDEAGPFLGCEALRAIAAAPPNRFVTLRLGGDELPELGADVLVGGEVVGSLTSPVESPRHGLIGLARLQTGVAADGATVEVAVGETTVPATVSHATMHDPEKLRVRS